MFTSLDKLKASELESYGYDDILKVIKALDDISLAKRSFIDTTERVDRYFEFIGIIKDRISSKEFSQIKDTQKVLNYLKKISDKISDYSDLNNFMRSNQAELREYTLKTKKNIEEQLNKTVTTVEKELEETKEQLENSEHNILTHVLTLLGVFSAVIITIMSVVITSSSWLNSANSNDAMMAFVAPILVTTFAVIVMLSLTHAFYGLRNTNSKSTLFFFIGIGIVVLILAGMIGWFAYLQNRACEAVHTRYVLIEEEYTVKDDLENNMQYYEITIDGKSYVFPVEESFLHDGTLYFCIEHEVLE